MTFFGAGLKGVILKCMQNIKLDYVQNYCKYQRLLERQPGNIVMTHW